jgi:site-specific recombinase XerD
MFDWLFGKRNKQDQPTQSPQLSQEETSFEPLLVVQWSNAIPQWRTSLYHPKTQSNYSQRFMSATAALRERIPLAQITLSHLDQIGEQIRMDELLHSKNTTLVALRSFFSFAHAHRWLRQDISQEQITQSLKGISRQREKKPNRNELRERNRRLLWAARQSRYYPKQTEAILGLLILRGVRASEIPELLVEDITHDPNRGWTLHIRGRHPRIIPLPESLLESIQWCCRGAEPHAPLFFDRQYKHALSARSVTVLLQSCCKRAGIEPLTPRTIRSEYVRLIAKPSSML